MNMDNEPERKVSKRGRRGEGRPAKRTPEVVAAIAQAIAQGLTDREAGLLAGIRHHTITEWRKDPEFSEAIERATAQRLLARLGIGAPISRAICEARGHEPDRRGKPGRQGSCRKGDCITRGEFDALVGRPGYRLRDNGDLERREGSG